MFAQNAIGFWSQTAAAPSYPAALDDGHHWWYDATDLTQITKDGSNLVSAWHSKGVADRPLLQADGAKQPLWVTPGTIRFNGVGQFLKTAAFTWKQPEFIYILIKEIVWSYGQYWFDGLTADTGGIRTYPNTYPCFTICAPIFVSNNANLQQDTWGIIRVLFKGTQSSHQVDTTTKISGNAGLNNMGGFTLGARGNNKSFANIEVKDIVCCDTDDAANEAEIYNWLVTRKP